MHELSVLEVKRVSTSAGGEQIPAETDLTLAPSLSPDGTKVAFHSLAPDLVSGDTNGTYDIFVRDLHSGAVERASIGAAGSQADGYSLYPILSADGTMVAFRSTASNLVPGDTNGTDDIFVRNLDTGAIVRIQQSANSGSHHLSADGGTVAVQAPEGIYVQDLLRGTAIRADTTADGSPPISFCSIGLGPPVPCGTSSTPMLTADGGKVAFASTLKNLVPGDTDEIEDVFLKDLSTGAIERILTNVGNFRLSADGTRIAFASKADGAISDLFVKDLTTGDIVFAATAADGTRANADFPFVHAISADGTRILFGSDADNLVPDDTNDARDLFLKDLTTGAILRVDVDAGGAETDGPVGGDLSGNGATVALDTMAALVPDDTNDGLDVYTARVTPPEGQIVAGTNRGEFLTGGAGDDVLAGRNGNDVMRGHYGADTVLGGNGRDILDGGPGADSLHGGNGPDRLTGGWGRDTLLGGNGPDVFDFNAIADSPVGGGDVIVDFSRSGRDRLDFADLFGGVVRFLDSPGSAFTGQGPEVRWERAGPNALVQADVQGNGLPDMELTLLAVSNLRQDDFWFGGVAV